MKRVWSALIALLFVLALFGCKGKESSTPPAIVPSFESDVKISFNDMEITCHLTQKDFNDAEIEIYTPEELKGMVITRTQDECTLSYKDMNYKLDLTKFPKASFAQIMTESYAQLVNSENVKIKKEEKYWIYEGKINSGAFIIKQNDDTGFVERIEVPQVNMIAEFSNIKSISNKP